jgi:hypothetical protein
MQNNPSKNNWLQTKKRPPASEDPPSLPLDWTRVQRRRRADDDDCCPVLDSSPLNAASLRPDQQLVEGLAVFCLHESDPQWFQGYFFPNFSTRKPWGILAVQEELDDCMKSADGGYRRCTLTIFPYPAQRKISMPGVEWTGGDMMRLMSHNQVSFDPDQLKSGKQAVPQVEKLFGGIRGLSQTGLK